MSTKVQEKSAGYIGFAFFDDRSDEVVTLGGAGFLTAAESEAAWANAPTFDGKSNY